MRTVRNLCLLVMLISLTIMIISFSKSIPAWGLVTTGDVSMSVGFVKDKGVLAQPTSNRPMILQGKGKTKTRRNKKMYDDLGNEINQQDADIMNDLAQGKHIKYYNETVYDLALKDDKPKSFQG